MYVGANSMAFKLNNNFLNINKLSRKGTKPFDQQRQHFECLAPFEKSEIRLWRCIYSENW
jgi:hypothetical protein